MRFGPFTLDVDTRQLTAGDRVIHLAPKAFELLALLVAERPKVLSKATLQERLWPGTFVAEANLANLVAEIREALGDQPRTPQYIRTSHGFGYAFCGTATLPPTVQDTRERSVPTCWLEWGERRFPLFAGEHVIGRDHDLAIRIEAPTVSRRHARVVVSADGVLLDDCGSKNGTFLAGTRVTSAVKVTNGDTIHVGSLLLTFRMCDGPMSTETNIRPAREGAR